MITRAVTLVTVAAWFAVSPVQAQTTLRARDTTKVVQVWVNTNSDKYHCPGSRYYGNTQAGEYQREDEARANGFVPANDRPCGPLPATVRVWVNTDSDVYHCPGSQYYGNTKQGEYMSEPEAVAAGFRPARNKRCAL